MKNENKPKRKHVSFKLPETKLRQWYCKDLIGPTEISKLADCSRQTVMNALDAYGIEHIPQGKRNAMLVERNLDTITKLAEENMSLNDIAKAVNVPAAALRNYAKEHDLALTTHAKHKAMMTEENLRKWYIDEGMSQQNIADIVGCHYSAVARAMKKYDIPIKDREGIVNSMRATVLRKYGADAPFRCESIQKTRARSHEMTYNGEKDQILKDAAKLRAKGYSVKSAAEELGISYFVLRRWIREQEDPSKEKKTHRRYEPIPEKELREAVDRGDTIAQMADQFHCCSVTVMKALKKYGLKTARARRNEK